MALGWPPALGWCAAPWWWLGKWPAPKEREEKRKGKVISLVECYLVKKVDFGGVIKESKGSSGDGGGVVMVKVMVEVKMVVE